MFYDFFFLQRRNQREEGVGYFEEIGFEQFLMVMSHFRAPNLKTTEEEKEVMRREKLRCKKPHFILKTLLILLQTKELVWDPFKALFSPVLSFFICFSITKY